MIFINECFNEKSLGFHIGLNQFCQNNPNIRVVSYNEDNYNDKKKAYRIKGGYSARMTPFVLIVNENKEFIKAFYSEDNGCTLDNIKKFLISNNYENSNN